MADANYDEYDDYGGYEPFAQPASAGGRWQRLVNGTGALTSLALVVGIGVWGYKLAVRDVTGVPVIRALEGPARIAPEDPGGMLALNQGLAVNRIAAVGTAALPADSLTLAPAPAGLSDEDAAMGALAGATSAPLTETPPAAQAPLGDDRLTPAALRPAEPLPDGAAEPIDLEDGAGTGTPFVAPDVIPESVPGVARSLRPLPRPVAGAASVDDVDVMAEAAAAAVVAALSPGLDADVDPATLASGTRLVQIGAYPNEAEARLEWDKTVTRFSALMEGKRRVIEKSESGGAEFYRLRVEGFTDAEDARAFCAALKADNAVCVPAAVK